MMPCMTPNFIDEAARHLVIARRESRKIDRLPESCRPGIDTDALLVQRRVVELLGEKIGGWKCALPKGEDVFVAPLLGSTIRTSSPCPIVPQNGMARIEPEIAFVMGRDLPAREKRYTEGEVRESIRETRLVLELIGSRHTDPKAVPFPEHLADSINNQGLFIGPTLANAFDRQLEALKITITAPSGVLLDHNGKHPNGHPLRPLVWLANFLSSRGETLRSGHIVTAGSYAGIVEVPMETPLTIFFGDLGNFPVTFWTTA